MNADSADQQNMPVQCHDPSHLEAASRLEVEDCQEELRSLHDKIKELERQVSRAERQNKKLQNYNDDLRSEVTKLSSELHKYRTSSTNSKDAAVQTCCKDDHVVGEETLGLGEGCESKPMPEWGSDSVLTGELSIAESLKATAEAVLSRQSAEASSAVNDAFTEQLHERKDESNSEYVYDASSGFYYHPATGYYWDPNSGLFYDYSSGTYYQHDENSGEYTFHSQVSVPANTQEISNENQVCNGQWMAEFCNYSSVDALTSKLSDMGLDPIESGDAFSDGKKLHQKRSRSKFRRVKKRSRKFEKQKSENGSKKSVKKVSSSVSFKPSTNKDKKLEHRDSHEHMKSRKHFPTETCSEEDGEKENGDCVSLGSTDDSERSGSDSNSSDSLATGESEMMSEPESGELSSSSDSDVEMVAVESAPQVYEKGFQVMPERQPAQNPSDELAENHPPCIRVIVLESDCLTEGSLLIITCAGGVIGRLKSPGLVIEIPDVNVSKEHARIDYDHTDDVYRISDMGSQNGTTVNGVRLVQVSS
ncbi:angiogenic factor with G patch and FHA domains 1 [Aplysia californica]|uniref:Angiogenic factor with G patch and FHA domains 1 n=1 Tax=Aplysia californica TaxID=6500 RepID=A0ABM1AAQ1_APLCA|nr:angiogenic factor with G patch and FHA domains 1 [Aplysia californica]